MEGLMTDTTMPPSSTPESPLESPPMTPKPASYILLSARRRRYEKIIGSVGALALVGVGLSGWVVANQQSSVASAWHHRDVAEVATNRSLSATLATARSSITTLNGRVVTLNGQMTTLNGRVVTLNGQITTLDGQLSTVATQKEKALDQNAVLSQLLSAAGAVSSDLATCVTDTDTFETELFNDINDGTVLVDPSLMSNATTVGDECNQAATANTQMQTAISQATGG